MSSKIHRGPKNAEAPPIEWRHAGHSAGTQQRAVEKSAPATSEATAIAMERQIEARLATARQQGKVEGEAAATLAGNRRLEPLLANLQAMAADLAGQRERARTSAEEDVVKLAIAIAKKVLHRELSTDPNAILGLVKAAFGKLNARETHRLRVAVSDAALLGEQRTKLGWPSAVEIVADATLTAGSAIFETERGQMEASIDSQLVEIERGLTDLLRQRTAS